MAEPLEVGQWYEPNKAVVPDRSDEERGRDERYIARLAAKGITGHDPWPRRRHALAVAALLQGVLEQFGIGAPIELRHHENEPTLSGRIERVAVEDGCLQVFFQDPEFGSVVEGDRYWVSVNCELVTAVRVLAAQ